MSEQHSTIRTIYLYLFALLGLVLLVIGGVRFVDMGLKAFVFTKAEETENMWQRPQMPMMMTPEMQAKAGLNVNLKDEDKVCLSTEEKQQFNIWLQDYKNWKDQQEKIDYVGSQRHRDASINLALMLVGLPLYLYHWRIIKKEGEK